MRIHSFQSLGTLDGPGLRYVVFLKGCPLRCACCHNPDTWTDEGAVLMSPGEVMDKIRKYKEYFGAEGGVTVSGGEALVQAEEVTELFKLCHKEGVNTCLDTSGCRLDEKVKVLLAETDLVILDIKYTNNIGYEKYVRGSFSDTLAFLSYLEEKDISTWLRQVSIEGKTDDKENLDRLAELSAGNSCVKRTELLAFRKLCVSKYEKLGIAFPFADIPEMSVSALSQLQAYLDKRISEIKEEEKL